MTEFKFRGKTSWNKWRYGDLTRYSKKMSYITDDLIEGEVYEVNAESVGMFTGFKDKNGMDIYSGDIITLLGGFRAVINFGEFEGFCPYDHEWMPSVGFYVTGIGRFERPMPLGPTEVYAEVIGNIYDNPELLEVNENENDD